MDELTTHFRSGLELISRMDRDRHKRMESGISSRAAKRRDRYIHSHTHSLTLSLAHTPFLLTSSSTRRVRLEMLGDNLSNSFSLIDNFLRLVSRKNFYNRRQNTLTITGNASRVFGLRIQIATLQ